MSLKKTKRAWKEMWKRCGGLSGNNQGVKLYINKGIEVCPEWREFDTFLSDMGLCPKGLTLDRIDNNKGYSKENCRWATHKEQTRNRSITKTVMYKGQSWFIQDLADHLGLRYDTLWKRLKSGWLEENLHLKANQGNLAQERGEKYANKYFYDGETYTLAQLAKKINCSTTGLGSHLKNGLSVEEAVSKIQNYKSKVVSNLMYKGELRKVTDLAKELNVSRNTLVLRATKLGWHEKDWGNKSNKVTCKVTYKGEEYLLADLARKLNLKYKTLHDRIFTNGWEENRWSEPTHR